MPALHRSPALVGTLGLVLALAVPLVGARRSGADTPFIAVDRVKAGMKGYGLTVFSGTSPERFDVEVIGVLHKFRPNSDLILIRTIHPRLEKVKVVAGMSGSPIFLQDGGTAKLAGAYAYGWSFGNEPIAGVTPIENMRAELARPLSPLLLPGRGGAPIGPSPAKDPRTAMSTDEGSSSSDGGASAFVGEPGRYSLREHVDQVAGRLRGTSLAEGGQAGARHGIGPLPVLTPLVVGGLSDRSFRALSELTEPLGLLPLQAGGAGSTTPRKDSPAHYVDGGAVAVQLMRGDIAAQATGTVTHVIGNKVLGFGHPMMELGATHLPAAIANILWILSSDQRSFKIGEAVRPLGTLTQDRGSCIVVDEAIPSPTIPMHLQFDGDASSPRRTWDLEIVHDRLLSPMWSAFAFGDAVSESIGDRRDATWTLDASIRLRGRGVVRVSDFGVGAGGVPGGAAFSNSRAGQAVGELLNNVWEPVVVERIDAKVAVAFRRDTIRLRGAELLESVVDPGRPVRVRLTLKPYQGPETSVVVPVDLDPVLAGKDVELEIVPGWSIVPETAAPESLDQLMANLQVPTLPPRSFVVQYKHPESGIAASGKVAAKLPGFALDALRPSSSTTQPEPFQVYVRRGVEVPGYAEGGSRLRVTVRPLPKQ